MFLDLTAIEEEFLNQCGPCDYGIPGGCNCAKRDYRSTMLDLVREVQRLRTELANFATDCDRHVIENDHTISRLNDI